MENSEVSNPSFKCEEGLRDGIDRSPIGEATPSPNTRPSRF
jgi:hypothetical protein